MKKFSYCFLIFTLLLNSFQVSAQDGSGYQGPPPPLSAADQRLFDQRVAAEEALAIETFDFARKYTDQLVTDTRFYSDLMTPNGRTIPVVAVEGQVAGTYNRAQRVALGSYMRENGSKAMFFTPPQRRSEAAAFKIAFEAENPGVILSIFEMADKDMQLYEKDAAISRLNVFQRVYERTKEGISERKDLLNSFKGIMKAQMTPATPAEKKSSIKWGLVSVGLSSAAFFTFDTYSSNLQFAITATILSCLTTMLLEYNGTKINNIIKAHMFRDFRFAKEWRRNTQKLIFVTAGSNMVGASGADGFSALELSPEAVLSNMPVQKGQDSIETQVRDQVINNSADRIVDYIKIMNGVLQAMGTAGVLGLEFDMGFLEMTQMQLFIIGANIGIMALIAQIKKMETRLRNFDLSIATRKSFIKYRESVVKSVRQLMRGYKLQALRRAATARRLASAARSTSAPQSQAGLGSSQQNPGSGNPGLPNPSLISRTANSCLLLFAR